MLAITKSEQFLVMLGNDVYEGPYFDGSPKREGVMRRVELACVRAYAKTFHMVALGGASPCFPQGPPAPVGHDAAGLV